MLQEVVEYTFTHKMKINQDKSKVMLFNSSKKYDFNPQLSLQSGANLLVVESYQLLGVIIQSNLKWDQNTDFICSKAFDRMWMIRRLKLLGATDSELIDVYYKQVRSVLEMAVAVWSPALTKHQVSQIERVQKTLCAVILGSNYSDYEGALAVLQLEPLSTRRKDLCTRFANKCFKNDKFKSWFVERNQNDENVKTRSEKTRLLPVQTRTKRYEKSPLPYLTNLLNDVKK